MIVNPQAGRQTGRTTPAHRYPAVIVVADQHSSRIFLRRRRNAPLIEKTEYADTADLWEHGARRPEALVRTGGRPRIKPRSQRSREELQEFLKHVAGRVDAAVTAEQGETLAIVAPPLILGELRDYIDDRTRSKLVCERCVDLVNLPLAEIDAATSGMKM